MTPSNESNVLMRGRPQGARTRVFWQQRALGRHHFAFVRAALQGLDLRSAWQRYLGFSDQALDLREIQLELSQLMVEVARRCQGLLAARAEGHPQAGALRHLMALGTHAGASAVDQGALAPGPVLVSDLPSLEAFAVERGLDGADLSHAELVALYEEAFGLASASDGRPRSAMAAFEPGHGADRLPAPQLLRALAAAEPLLAQAPGARDPLELWFAPPTLGLLLAAGWRCIEDLGQDVATLGHRWYRMAPGIGATRGNAIAAWLAEQHKQWGRSWPAWKWDAHLRAQRRVGGAASGPPIAALPSPIERWRTTREYAGGSGGLPGGPPEWAEHATPAEDARLVEAWLRRFRGQPSTFRAYRKELERFIQWCVLVRGCGLADLCEADATAWLAFARHPPASWVNPTPVPRSHPDWRPFRAAPGAAAWRFGLGAVARFLDHLVSTGHRADNPFALLRSHGWPAQRSAGPDLPDALPEPPHGGRPDGDVTSESPASAASAHDRRRRWMAAAMGALGLCLGEMVRASCRWPQRNELAEYRVGAGPWWPMDQACSALLAAHLADAACLGPLPSPAPLLCNIRAAPGRWLMAADGEMRFFAAGARPRGSALSLPAARRALRRWAEAAPALGPAGRGVERFHPSVDGAG